MPCRRVLRCQLCTIQILVQKERHCEMWLWWPSASKTRPAPTRLTLHLYCNTPDLEISQPPYWFRKHCCPRQQNLVQVEWPTYISEDIVGMTWQYRKDLGNVFLAWVYGERDCHWSTKSSRSLALLEWTQKAVKTDEWSVKAVQFHLLSLVMAGSLCKSMAKEWSGGHQLQFRMENPWTFPLEPEVPHPVFADDLLRRRWLSSNCHKGHRAYLAMCFAKDKINSLGINSWWYLKIPSHPTPTSLPRSLCSIFASQPERG